MKNFNNEMISQLHLGTGTLHLNEYEPGQTIHSDTTDKGHHENELLRCPRIWL